MDSLKISQSAANSTSFSMGSESTRLAKLAFSAGKWLQKQKKSSYFRKTCAYITVFSHLFSSYAFAVGPFHIIEEDLPSPITIKYADSKMGVIAPTVKVGDITHNILGDTEITEGGAIFKSAPGSRTIYNRIYSNQPTYLSGTIESDQGNSIMVFASPGGIDLENPDFRHVHTLSLLAGGIAQTERGMAYGIEQGRLSLKKTIFKAEEDVKQISLAGRTIKIEKSIVAPEDKIEANIGQHVRTLQNEGEISILDGENSKAHGSELIIDEKSILQSKSISLRSLEENGQIHARGLIQSTLEDIIIQARGDIYINKILSARNLQINTDGMVYFGDQAWVKGKVHVKARDIYVAENLRSEGELNLDASRYLQVDGTVASKDKIYFKGQGGMRLRGAIASTSGASFLSQDDIVQEGSLLAGGDLTIEGSNFLKKGHILSEGALNIHAHNNIDLPSGDLLALHTGTLLAKHGRILNQSRISSDRELLLEGADIENFGILNTGGSLETKGNFTNFFTGEVKAKSVKSLASVINGNKGTIEVADTLKLTQDITHLKGVIKTKSFAELIGQELTLEGSLVADQGLTFNLGKFVNKGSLTVAGSGAQGQITSFNNKGDIELAGASLNCMDSENEGVLRTKGHFVLRGGSFHNKDKGLIFTCGVHQVDVDRFYKDEGRLYTPTLLLLKGENLTFLRNHQSYLKDGIIQASSRLSVNEGANFNMKSDSKCFLQFSSGNDLEYAGSTILSSGQFPHMEYFKTSNEIQKDRKDSNAKSAEPSITYQDFMDEIKKLSLNSWVNTRKALGSGFALSSGKGLNYKKGSVQLESGSIRVSASGKLQAYQGNLQAGCFTGNNVLLQSANAILDTTTISSFFGVVQFHANNSAHINQSYLQGGERVNVSGTFVDINKSQVISTASQKEKDRGFVNIAAENTANLNQSYLRGGKGTNIQATTSIDLSKNRIEGAYNTITADHVRSTNDTTTGTTVFYGKQSLNIKDLKGEKVSATSKEKVHLEGENKVDSLHVEGKHVTNDSSLKATDSINLQGEVVEQNRTMHADKNINIEAKQQYIDNDSSRNIAGGLLRLKAQQNNGFRGHQQADTAVIDLHDMKLKNLLNQVTARVTEAHLKSDIVIDEDLIIKHTLHLWANRLENKAKVTANGDFIAHMQQAILNEGVMDVHGTGGFFTESSFTNTGQMTITRQLLVKARSIYNTNLMKALDKAALEGTDFVTNRGTMSGQQGLGIKTEGVFTQKDTVDSGNGDLSIEADSMEANAEVESYQTESNPDPRMKVTTIGQRVKHSKFLGNQMSLKTKKGISAKGAELDIKKNAYIEAGGAVDFDPVAYQAEQHQIDVDFGFARTSTKTDPRTKYHVSKMNVGENLVVKTPETFTARGIQATTGGNMFIKADKGVDVSSLASVYVAERKTWNTGLFGQNRHERVREDVDFYQSSLSSKNGGIYILANDGGITGRGAAFSANGEIHLDAKGKVDLNALKATVNTYQYDEDKFLCFGSSDEKNIKEQRAKVMQAQSNKKIKIHSKEGTIESEAPHMSAPQMDFHGEKGVYFNSLEQQQHENQCHIENNLNISTNIEFEHKERKTQTNQTQQVGGTLKADNLSISTGQGAKASMAMNITGHKEGGKTDIVADTDELNFIGTKSTWDSKTNSWSVSVSIDPSLTPGAGGSIGYEKLGRTTYGATVQNFGVFHNKRKGAKVVVQGGAQTSIDETTGEDMDVDVDRNALDQETQEGFEFGIKVSSTGSSVRASAKGGEKISADKLTSLRIGKSSNNVRRTDINHDDQVKDTRWGFGIGVSTNAEGLSSVSVNAQIGDAKVGGSVSLDKNPLETLDPANIKDLKSANDFVGGLASINQTANDLGINTGPVGAAINGVHKATSIATQAQQTYSTGTSLFKGEGSFLKQAEKLTDTVGGMNDMARQVDIDTGPVGGFIDTARSTVRAASNAESFGERVSENFKFSEPANLNSPVSFQGTIPSEEEENSSPEEEELVTAVEDKMEIASSEDSENSEDEAKDEIPNPKRSKLSKKTTLKAPKRNIATTKTESEDGSEDGKVINSEPTKLAGKGLKKTREIIQDGNELLETLSNPEVAKEKLNELGTKEQYVTHQLKRLEEKAKAEGKAWGEDEQKKAEAASKIAYSVLEVAATGRTITEEMVHKAKLALGEIQATVMAPVRIVLEPTKVWVQEQFEKGVKAIGADDETAKWVGENGASYVEDKLISTAKGATFKAHKVKKPHMTKEQKPVERYSSASLHNPNAFTEPQLPPKNIVNDKGVEIVHYTRSNDHGPAHLHVKGQGEEVRIGQNGKPLKGNSELTTKQQQVIEENKPKIRKAIRQMQKWHQYQQQQKEGDNN